MRESGRFDAPFSSAAAGTIADFAGVYRLERIGRLLLLAPKLAHCVDFVLGHIRALDAQRLDRIDRQEQHVLEVRHDRRLPSRANLYRSGWDDDWNLQPGGRSG